MIEILHRRHPRGGSGAWTSRGVYLPSDDEIERWRLGLNDREHQPFPAMAGGAGTSFMVPALPMSQNTATIVSASVTETSLCPSLPLAANQMRSGSHYRITVWGAYTSSSSPVTQTWRLRLGTNGSSAVVASDTAVAASGAFTPTASQVSASFFGHFELECYTPTGQGLTVAEVGMGYVLVGLSTAITSAASVPIMLPQSAPATVAVASNAALFLTPTLTLGATTAGNSAVAWMYMLEDVGA